MLPRLRIIFSLYLAFCKHKQSDEMACTIIQINSYYTLVLEFSIWKPSKNQDYFGKQRYFNCHIGATRSSKQIFFPISTDLV